MKKTTLSLPLGWLSLLICLCNVKVTQAQQHLNWHLNFGTGLTSMRNFSYSFEDLNYQLKSSDEPYTYKIKEKPAVLLQAGLSLSGDFNKNKLLGWETGLNLRTAGFRISPTRLETTGELPSVYEGIMPDFDQIKSFRYWALHVPLSLNYRPFGIVGFSLGGDLYYQLSANITRDEFPHGKLGKAMGNASIHSPKYRHPFHFGGHVGFFAAINEKVRLDAQLTSDFTPRLRIDKQNISNIQLRELGLVVNLKYKLAW